MIFTWYRLDGYALEDVLELIERLENRSSGAKSF